ncbi:MAG: protein kinase [Bradymonadaceae bacterium]|nr:protein kinase [Lujinxingiaceae bacterium]
MNTEGLTLGDILDDLTRIVGTVADHAQQGTPASYDIIQQSLGSELRLHLLSYVGFLESNNYLTYDRVGDQMTVTEEGLYALEQPTAWMGVAEIEFAEQILGDEAGDDSSDVSNSDFTDFLGDLDLDAFGGESGGGESGGGESGGGASSSGRFGDSNSNSRDTAEGEAVSRAPEASFFDVDAPSEPALVSAPVEAPMVHEAAPQPAPIVEPVAKFELPAKRPAPMTNSSFSSSTVAPSPARPQSQGRSMEEDYERIEEIGSGGIGSVFRARQVRLNRDVAIKEVRDIFNVFAGVQREDIIERFTEIVQTQAKLLHPNIVQIIDISTETEFPFVATQYAPNGNLRRLIDVEGRPPLGVALKYFLQILHALNAAHDKGIVHGSLKPENVVLDAAGNALLSDFGMARVVEREGGRGNQVYVGVGTVAYMSPEQFQDPNTATVKSDIYSLGIMFYEMLTGKVPGRRSPMPSSFYPDIPRKLDDIFDCMSMDRESDRFGSIDEIIAEIYGAQEVMAILDKRSGVLFLRDPLQFGELGIPGMESSSNGVSSLAESIMESSVDYDYSPRESYVAASSDESLEESSVSEVEERSGDETVDSGEVEAGESSESDDSEASEPSDDEGVLAKLDKYGELFAEDD